MANTETILYKELSYKIMEVCFEVHNALGPGFPESLYENAVVKEFDLRKIPTERQRLIEVFYKGKKIGEYRLDLVVIEKIILELKAVADLNRLFEAQLYSYLKAAGLRLGILVNFGSKKVEYKRILC